MAPKKSSSSFTPSTGAAAGQPTVKRIPAGINVSHQHQMLSKTLQQQCLRCSNNPARHKHTDVLPQHPRVKGTKRQGKRAATESGSEFPALKPSKVHRHQPGDTTRDPAELW